MKKLLLTLSAVLILLGGTMTAQAYNETVSGVQCFCTITNKRSVLAYTAASNTTVTITSTAYNSAGGSIVTNGDAKKDYAGVNYTTGQDIAYAIQTHTAPLLGVSVTLTQYA